MIKYKKELIDIFEKDDSPLLNVSLQATSLDVSQKLVEIFSEINDFYKKNNREPKLNKGIAERRLFTILKEIRLDFDKKKLLKQYDFNNLLGDIKEISSLEDIFENDLSNILDTSVEDELLKIQSFDINRAKTDFVAKRKPIENFEKYKDVFKKIHSELKSNKRKIIKFEDKDLKEGNFFVLDGMVFLLEKIDNKSTKIFNDKSQGNRKRYDPRTVCIFENGMKSNMYLRSLQKLLYKNGKRVSESQEEILEIFNKNFSVENPSGYIYVLRSLSEKQQIKNIPDLYKIGFSKNEVSIRIKNAPNETTFLNDNVEIISETKIIGYKPGSIENIIQSFFAARKMNIEVLDKKNKKVYPDEWFSVPIDIIHQAIDLLRKNNLIGHRYDEIKKEIYKV